MTRHRKSLIRDHVKAANRVHTLLEGANIKLGNVVSDVLGLSGRAMLDAPWARLCPGTHESAGKRRSSGTGTGTGNNWLRMTLLESAWAARCETD